MRFHTRLIVPSVLSLIALQLIAPQGQPAAQAEESELVIKTEGADAKPETKETKDAKPEPAKEPVRLRLERRAEARSVERVPDHHTAESVRDRRPIRREVLRTDACVDVRALVGRDRSGAEPREVLGTGRPAEAAGKRLGECRAGELARA